MSEKRRLNSAYAGTVCQDVIRQLHAEAKPQLHFDPQGEVKFIDFNWPTDTLKPEKLYTLLDFGDNTGVDVSIEGSDKTVGPLSRPLRIILTPRFNESE